MSIAKLPLEEDGPRPSPNPAIGFKRQLSEMVHAEPPSRFLRGTAIPAHCSPHSLENRGFHRFSIHIGDFQIRGTGRQPVVLRAIMV